MSEDLVLRLRRIKDQSRRSLRELERATNISNSALSRYLSGQATPPGSCRHDHRSANAPSSQPAKAVYLREDRVLAKLPLLHHMLTAAEPAAVITGAPASAARPIPPSPEEGSTACAADQREGAGRSVRPLRPAADCKEVAGSQGEHRIGGQ